jgi:arsenite-transporting ATPase
LYPEEVRGARLLEFWCGAQPLTSALPAPLEASPAPLLATRVEDRAVRPSLPASFLIFAGKGGVGKTTLACATALRLTQDLPGKEILLFSTDPAHSLGDCLDIPVGPRPVRLAPGLTAVEIDAVQEFAAFRRLYQQELERMLGAMFQHLDLPFDRQVLERLLDLAPPGLDEIMAPTRAMEFLEEARYDFFLLDAAPTGHLLRLLELPELIDQWLKSFFGVLLKYRLTFRLPGLSQRLVRFSRDLKNLRTQWRDPRRAALYAVAIPTELALQETRDLVAAARRWGLAVPVIFLNQVTPPAVACRLCAALNRRESEITARFRQVFPDQHLTLIYRAGDLRGLHRLRQLGRALYCPPSQEKPDDAALNLPVLSS